MIVTSTADEARPYTRTLLGGLDGPALSRVAATWPDPLFALFAGADLRGLADRDLPLTRVDSVDDLMNLLTIMNLSVSDRETQVRTVVRTLVVDSLDGMERLVDFNADKVHRLLETLCALDVNVVFLSALHGPVPSVALGDGVAEYVDLALNLDGHRLQAWPDDRRPWVVDRSGRLPSQISVTFTDDHHRLAGFLNHNARPAPYLRPDLTMSLPRGQRDPLYSDSPPAPAVATPEPAIATPEPAIATPTPEPEPAPEPEGLPMCTSQGAQGNECLGQVESDDSLDLSMLRFRKPMCGPCGTAEYEARPKAVPRKTRPAPARPEPAASAGRTDAPAGRTGRDEDVAVMPRGDVVGRIATGDEALRQFLNT